MLNHVMDDDGPVVLNPEAFQYALTSDIHLYKPDWETKLSTHFEDVESAELIRFRRQDTGLFRLSKFVLRGFAPGNKTNELKRTFTFPQIDLDADTFESQAFTVILAIMIVTFYIGFYSIWLPGTKINCDGSTFGCLVLTLLINWFAFLIQMTLSGTCIVLVATLGNHAYNTKKSWSTFLKLILTTSIIPVLASLTLTDMTFGTLITQKKAETVQWAQYLTFIFAVMLVFLQVVSFLSFRQNPYICVCSIHM